MAYILGFFVADGYVTVNKRGGQFWCIEIKDKKLIEAIKGKIESSHKISIRKRHDRNSTYRLQIGSIEMCEDLRCLGFGQNKTKNLGVIKVPDKYFFSFVRGYFDGDGNVWSGQIHKGRKTKHKSLLLGFTSCSHEFLKSLQTRLGSYGIEGGSLFRSKKKEFSRLQYSTKNALKLYDFMYNGNIKDFSGLFLNRKKKIFDKFKSLRL